MDKANKLAVLRESGVIAIMRAGSSGRLIEAADAIRRGGVRAIEVTMTTPDALDVVGEASKRYKNDVIFGAGSVLDAETARAAILAGATFVVSPALDLAMIELCNRYAVPVIPGVLTPTEAVAALQAGVSMVKLFPAEIGGPRMVAALLAPLPHLEIVPVGGVDLENAAAYIKAGAIALGVGSSLVSERLLEAKNMAELTRRAAAFIEAVKLSRAQ